MDATTPITGPGYPSWERRPEASDDRADLLAMVTHWYGCVLSAEPKLLDHNTPFSTRVRIMKVLVADAECLVELVYGTDDDRPATDARPEMSEYVG